MAVKAEQILSPKCISHAKNHVKHTIGCDFWQKLKFFLNHDFMTY